MLLKINEKPFRTKVVFSEPDIQKGMMNKVFDDTFNSMFFMVKNGEHCFWMKNCLIPLDIIFIKDNLITKIHHNCLPCLTDDCKNYCGIGDAVLEVRGETCRKLGIKEGDEISF